jgi:hypothetical protein
MAGVGVSGTDEPIVGFYVGVATEMEVDMGVLAKPLFGKPHSLISAELLEMLLADYPRHDFHVRLWDGTLGKVQ